MEYALWGLKITVMDNKKINVLILVLMEYALWDLKQLLMKLKKGLNPCFNGICSLSAKLFPGVSESAQS